jgi:hypothetical protein
MDALDAALKKSGLATTAREYVDRRASLSDLVAAELWLNAIAVGALQKGDYVVVNHMKVPKMAEWIAFEKKVWQPFAESMANAGRERPEVSSLNRGRVPKLGCDFKLNDGFAERFKKVHPDMDLNQTLDSFEKFRSIGSMEMLRVEDFVAPAK